MPIMNKKKYLARLASINADLQRAYEKSAAASRHANDIWLAYVQCGDPATATKILKRWAKKMDTVHALRDKMCQLSRDMLTLGVVPDSLPASSTTHATNKQSVNLWDLQASLGYAVV